MLEKESKEFLEKIFTNLDRAHIDIGHWEIDHLCYRTSTDEQYDDAKKYFAQKGECLIESEVNGRLIATYKLYKPIHYKNWVIDLVEVPAPKPNKLTLDGFEHIEVVIDQPFSKIINQYPMIDFETKGLQKELNPELEIEFEDCAIKFHHKSLEHIINIEKNQSILNFLQETKILSQLKSYNPCLSGTFPLDITHSDSDLDILTQSSDFNQFEQEVSRLFSEWPKYSVKKKSHQGLDSSIVNFNYRDLSIEIFCQNQCVFAQPANQHFLIEGRLLKLLGNKFKDKIKSLKQRGMKTEPAFGQLLELKDPYLDLIKLNQLSDAELLKKYHVPFE